jgi:hypothetical protein
MLQLFDAADLEANPREAKAGTVTADIIDSISETPETFPFMLRSHEANNATNWAFGLLRNLFEADDDFIGVHFRCLLEERPALAQATSVTRK